MSGEEEVAKVQTVFVQVHELAQTVCYYNHVVNWLNIFKYIGFLSTAVNAFIRLHLILKYNPIAGTVNILNFC